MIAFEKISIEQYCTDWQSKHAARVEKPEDVYKEIALPDVQRSALRDMILLRPMILPLRPAKASPFSPVFARKCRTMWCF